MCIATMKSMTYAMKAKSALDARGIAAEIVSLDPSLTRRGCAYGISFPCGMGGEVKRLFEQKSVAYGELIGDIRP